MRKAWVYVVLFIPLAIVAGVSIRKAIKEVWGVG